MLALLLLSVFKGTYVNRIGQSALKDAFYHYVSEIHNGVSFDESLWSIGFFTYLPTKKQQNKILSLARVNGWGVPDVRGMTITGSFVAHVINARMKKDGATWEDCAEILSSSFHATSQIAENVSPEHDRQGLMFNSKKRVSFAGQSQYAISVFSIENEISPVTAYTGNRARFESKTGR